MDVGTEPLRDLAYVVRVGAEAMSAFHRDGFSLGRLHVTWYDLWAKKFCWEVAWRKL